MQGTVARGSWGAAGVHQVQGGAAGRAPEKEAECPDRHSPEEEAVEEAECPDSPEEEEEEASSLEG